MTKFYTKSGACHDIDDKDVLINGVVLPKEFNPHNVRLWIIGHDYRTLIALAEARGAGQSVLWS